ncbi:hypothetical protein CCACVL1_24732 [Corchorus capsularis]|uniref:Uncharacterized protein n=1 Tax=Corchorus capsularis TaxID=210143 RepID=A0A1R3GNL3_COCAP|nr:hypothetical protein CCACVL1_24732 [Corchorus capsularis]
MAGLIIGRQGEASSGHRGNR